jgi:signal transduction histidine kinase
VRSRLSLLVAATTLLVLIAFLVPLALLVSRVAENDATSRATVRLQTVAAVVGTGATAADVTTVIAVQSAPISVFLPGGDVLGAEAPRSPAVRLAVARRAALSVDTPAGREIVTPVIVDGATTVVRIVVPVDELRAGVTRAWLVLAGLGLALIVLGLLVADRLARTIVAPITDLSAVSHRLANAELTARAQPAGPPELREVAGALNHLASRIQDLLRDERERVADLSHRLRTPLTALRLEAESITDPDESARLAAAADAVERAVTAVIQQARRRDAGRPAAERPADATVVVAERLSFWSVLAEDTDREVRAELPSVSLPVAVPADDLAAALDALLGNVFAHTPDGTAFGVGLQPRPGGGAVLTVTDDGPGFPAGDSPGPLPEAAAVTPVLRRGASGSGSTGLGLDIARRAAEAAGGSLSVGAGPHGGASVRLELTGPGSLPAVRDHAAPR